MQMLLALKLHSIATARLLLKLEHVGVKAKVAEQTVAELLEFAEHLIFFFRLLSCDTTWQGCESSAARLPAWSIGWQEAKESSMV